MYCLCDIQRYLYPAGYFEEMEAQNLADVTGAPIRLTRLIIEAELEAEDLTDEERQRRRIEITFVIMRVLNLFTLSRARGIF